MNDMHFEGTIIKAWFHPDEQKTTAVIQLRVIIDVVEEILVEEAGTLAQLSEKFKLPGDAFPEWEGQLTGRHCNILRNAAGYHCISMK